MNFSDRYFVCGTPANGGKVLGSKGLEKCPSGAREAVPFLAAIGRLRLEVSCRRRIAQPWFRRSAELGQAGENGDQGRDRKEDGGKEDERERFFIIDVIYPRSKGRRRQTCQSLSADLRQSARRRNRIPLCGNENECKMTVILFPPRPASRRLDLLSRLEGNRICVDTNGQSQWHAMEARGRTGGEIAMGFIHYSSCDPISSPNRPPSFPYCPIYAPIPFICPASRIMVGDAHPT